MTQPTYRQHTGSAYEPSGKKELHQPFRLGDAWERLMVAKNTARVHVLIPLEAILKDAFKNYPTTTSYMMVLAGMSVIPIIAFIGFSLCVSSILVGIGITFVLTWGSVIIGCAFFALMISLAFLVAAAFWVVVGLFMTIFVLRLMYNVQTSFVHKVKHSQVIKELVNHANEKRLHHHQQNDMAEDVKSS
ncbi:hypothetical protein PGTUg99_023248 [Puccinia graminis f. sp. tritici]|uniref:Promethin n=2 Tax=Puccinia graminis f. sp. tritici TaxID=56615 RepID=E3K752_PUCGT|nr:uncharacterized protein PGTG_05207 [Puccinia graminis f. sp. tritici CRL 75-36-700-3]EFP79982.1 hypothetical protein PGTG_05207 [Puccinia graminis f. sp. tritici CRL 75-36-700-3]KAA1075858.1 hypothetical protein PGTUg99_023248 [Puccinia graminis f. sp. tritici]